MVFNNIRIGDIVKSLLLDFKTEGIVLDIDSKGICTICWFDDRKNYNKRVGSIWLSKVYK